MIKRISLSFFLFFIYLSINAIEKKNEIDTDIPVLKIETIDGVMPTCDIIEAPEGCFGTSITNNNYVSGRMVITLKSDTVYDSKEYVKGQSGMAIKIRGNSTGAFLNQHPYKIKLSSKDDLLRRQDDSFNHKEWVLLSMYTWNKEMSNSESNILTIVGLLISKIIGMEWCPNYELVHLIINHDYQGMYYLIEPIERGKRRIDISKTGFLIEHDAFWWKENVYFKSNYIDDRFAYTYKYPDDDDVTEEVQDNIKSYINLFEESLYNNDRISNYIDLESFAKWLLIHDILGSEAIGSNRFLYKYDLKQNNIYTSKLKMSTPWDFDSSFRCSSWSDIHHSSIYYFPKLLENTQFLQTYLSLWNNIKPSLLSQFKDSMNVIKLRYADIFDRNMKIHQTKYPTEGTNSFANQVDEVIEKIADRISILEQLITTDINQNVNISIPYKKSNPYNLNGQRIQLLQLNKGIYIRNGNKYVVQ